MLVHVLGSIFCINPFNLYPWKQDYISTDPKLFPAVQQPGHPGQQFHVQLSEEASGTKVLKRSWKTRCKSKKVNTYTCCLRKTSGIESKQIFSRSEYISSFYESVYWYINVIWKWYCITCATPKQSKAYIGWTLMTSTGTSLICLRVGIHLMVWKGKKPAGNANNKKHLPLTTATNMYTKSSSRMET